MENKNPIVVSAVAMLDKELTETQMSELETIKAVMKANGYDSESLVFAKALAFRNSTLKNLAIDGAKAGLFNPVVDEEWIVF